jgi:hypothetical protein
MKKIFLLLALVFSAFNSIEKDPVNVIDVLSTPKSIMTNLSDIASDIEYIPLQTTPNSIIGRIISIKVRGNYIYVATVDRKLFCFDKSGKYLLNLNKVGKGPEEYEYCSEFDVNETNSIIAVKGLREIILYKQTSEDFIFLKRVKLANSPDVINFTGKNDNILLQYSNTYGTNPFSKELINLNGETLHSWPNYMKFQLQEKISVMSRYEITSYNFKNELYLKEVGNDTILKLTEKNKIESFLIFDSKNKRVTPDVRSNVKYYADHMYEYFVLQKLFGSERFIYYTYSINKESHPEIYDQSTKIRYRIPDKEFLKDDIAGGVNFEPQYCNDGIFYSWIEANKFKAFTSSDLFKNAKVKIPAKNIALKNLDKVVTEFDNPIVIVAKIK